MNVTSFQKLETKHTNMSKLSGSCGVDMVLLVRARPLIKPFARNLFHSSRDLRGMSSPRGHSSRSAEYCCLAICEAII